MIYVVSGHMRTGTSMMMQALEAGGMDAVYKDDRYELPPEECVFSIVVPENIDGKLIKCLTGASLRLAAWNWKIVVMLRDYAEVKASYQTLFSDAEVFHTENGYYQMRRYHLGILTARRDIQWIGVQYKAVLNDALGVFRVLKNNGWPIEDVDKAAAIIDPEKCHHAG